MISLTCTHCQTVLSIDDAFAGGVCRCQHCGTIQTVPSHLKNGAAVKSGAQAVGAAPKTLYQSRRQAGLGRGDETGSGTGLEDLADVVASSGLGGSGLSSSTRPRKRQQQRREADAGSVAPSAAPSKKPLLIAGGAFAAVVIAVAIWWFVSAGSRAAQPMTGGGSDQIANGQAPSASPDQATATAPQFCGIPLSGSSVVYLLDRGDSAKSVFDATKEAAYKSIQSLGSDRKFQVLLWDNDTTAAGYPSGSTTFATKENLAACQRALEDVTAEHQSTIDGPLARAVAEAPDSIVIVTAKGFELDDSFTTAAESILKSSPIKLYTISIQDEGQADCAPLQKLAKQSGGVYKSLSDGAIRAAGGDPAGG
jgi:transposase-like protein